MAYTLAKKLHKERSCSSTSLQPAASGVVIEELKPCVMYCGPSNQAVNVVLGKPCSYKHAITRIGIVIIVYRHPHTTWYSSQR